MKLIELLEVLTISKVNGVKLFASRSNLDEHLIFKGSYSELSNHKEFDDEVVFQVITSDYENYAEIILDKVGD